jgi:hypothetical protein
VCCGVNRCFPRPAQLFQGLQGPLVAHHITWHPCLLGVVFAMLGPEMHGVAMSLYACLLTRLLGQRPHALPLLRLARFTKPSMRSARNS